MQDKDEWGNTKQNTGNPKQQTGNPKQQRGNPKQHTGNHKQQTGNLKLQTGNPSNQKPSNFVFTSSIEGSFTSLQIKDWILQKTSTKTAVYIIFAFV